MDIERSSAHFEQIVNDIVCVNCLIEFSFIFFSFTKIQINMYIIKKSLKKIKNNFFYDVCHSLDIYKMDKINKCILKDMLLLF